MNRSNRPILIRITLAVALGCIAFGVYLLNQRKLTTQPGAAEVKERQQELSTLLGSIDRDVDSVLTRFGIEKEWIRKRQISLEKVNLTRTERRVAVPEHVLPISMNAAFNTMAKRYNGRAVASENLKENTVTIHIEVEGYLIQTIIVKPTPNLRHTEKTQKQIQT